MGFGSEGGGVASAVPAIELSHVALPSWSSDDDDTSAAAREDADEDGTALLGRHEEHVRLLVKTAPSSSTPAGLKHQGDERGSREATSRTWHGWRPCSSCCAPCSDEALGFALYVAGVTSASFTALSARLLHDEGIAVHWILLARTAAGLVIIPVLLARQGVTNWLGYRRRALCLRGLFGLCAVYSFFVTSSYLPLADAALPGMVAPLVTAAVAAAALGERPHWAVWACFPVCMAGAVLVVQPRLLFGDRQRPLSAVGVAAASALALFGGVSKVLVRILSGGLSPGRGGGEAAETKKEHPLIIMGYTNVACVVGMTMLALWSPSIPCVAVKRWWWVLTLWVVSSASGFSAQMCITSALGLVSASSSAPIQYLSVVFGALWGLLCLRETPGALESVGIVIVMIGSGVTNAASLKKEESSHSGQ